MGAPYFKIKDLCQKNGVYVFSSNYALYGDMSRRVMRVLGEFTPEMEIYSIDEAFLSLSGFKNLGEYGLKIRSRVLKDLGLPVSVGIAPTKVLSKIANHIAKKRESTGGVFILKPDNHRELSKFPVGDIWGIGRKSAYKLKAAGIHTALQLQGSNEYFVQKTLSIVGRRILKELKGKACIDLELETAAKKGIMASKTFGKPIFKKQELSEAIATHISTAAEKLRKQNSVARELIIFIRTNPHKNTPQYSKSYRRKILAGTSSTNKLIRNALEMLDSIFVQKYEYKKCGVMLTDFSPKNQSQLDLFYGHDNERNEAVMKALDQLNGFHGRHSVKYAACGVYQDWKMISKMRSQCYTTRWSEILKVK